MTGRPVAEEGSTSSETWHFWAGRQPTRGRHEKRDDEQPSPRLAKSVIKSDFFVDVGDLSGILARVQGRIFAEDPELGRSRRFERLARDLLNT